MSVPRLSRSRWGRTAVAAGVLLVLFVAFRSLRGRPVPSARVERKDLVATLVVNGRVLALRKTAVGSAVTARVTEVLVDEGARVAKGDVLARLDVSEAEAALAEARSRSAQAEAALAGLTTTSSRVAAEAHAQARLELEQARRDLQRAEALGRDGFVSDRDLEDARRAVDLAVSRETSAALTARSAAPGGAEERRVSAELAAARAAEAAASARLLLHSVRAPADGTVLTRTVERGDVVSPGTALFTVALDAETLLLAQPDERNLSSLSVGQRARASADAFPDRSFPAEVVLVSPGVDLARGTVDVRLRVPEPPPYLRPDMTLSVEIETGRKAGALVVPVASVLDPRAKPWVLVVEKGRAARRDVTLGLSGGEVAEVVAGLVEGEQVLLPAVPPVRAGERVRTVLSR